MTNFNQPQLAMAINLLLPAFVKTIRRMFLLLLAATICAVVHGLLTGRPDLDVPADAYGLALEQVLRKPALLWVDGRPAAAYEAGHFPGAVHLTLDDWDAGLGPLLEQWEPGVAMVVYCDGGGCESSRTIASRLREELGEEAVFWLVGGWEVLKTEVPAP
jgi:rhodanese-related sulfurtransferase